jgi:hypothetical protein
MIAFADRLTVGRHFLHWVVLAGIFLCLSVDEAIQFHEKLNAPIRSMLNLGGFLYYASVIPGALFLVVLAVAYSRFIFDLPAKVRLLIVVAATLYIAGVIGMELIDGYVANLMGTQHLGYAH